MANLKIRAIEPGDTIRLNFTAVRIIDNEFSEPCVLLKDAMGVITDSYTQEELDAADAAKADK